MLTVDHDFYNSFDLGYANRQATVMDDIDETLDRRYPDAWDDPNFAGDYGMALPGEPE